MAKKVKPLKIEFIRMAHKGIPLGVPDIAKLTGLAEKTIKKIVYNK